MKIEDGAESAKSCPSCGQPGKPVKPITLESLLKPEARSRMANSPYRFCASSDCEVVYFGELDAPVFCKADLRVRVGIKETEAPRYVCYCFEHTIEEIEDGVRRTGDTGVLVDIKTRMKEACWCETKSPQGSCCLGTVAKHVKAAKETIGSDQSECPSDLVEECCASAESESAAETSRDDSDRGKGRSEKTGTFAMLGGLLSAVVASACCWLPLLLITLGVSGAAVGVVFERYRPIFLTTAFLLLSVAFYYSYRRRPSADREDCCAPGSAKVNRMRKVNRAMLWAVTAVTLAFAFFPSYVGALLGDTDKSAISAEMPSITIAIEGMTCEACATTLENELAKHPAVEAVDVDYGQETAVIVETPGSSGKHRESILEVIRKAGYRGRFPNEPASPIVVDGNPTSNENASELPR